MGQIVCKQACVVRTENLKELSHVLILDNLSCPYVVRTTTRQLQSKPYVVPSSSSLVVRRSSRQRSGASHAGIVRSMLSGDVTEVLNLMVQMYSITLIKARS